MRPFSIFQPASAGFREGAPPRAGTVQPVKSWPLKSGFHRSADCSDGGSPKQSSVTTATEMPFIVNPPTLEFRRCRAQYLDRNLVFESARFIGSMIGY